VLVDHGDAVLEEDLENNVIGWDPTSAVEEEDGLGQGTQGLALGFKSPGQTNEPLVIEYNIAVDGNSSLVVYDVSGRTVRVLRSGELRKGRYVDVFDWSSDSGVRLASGVYFIRLRNAHAVLVERAVLVR